MGATIKLPNCDNVILVACFYRLGNLQEEWFTITMLLHVQHLSQSKITVMKYLCLPHQSKIFDIMHSENYCYSILIIVLSCFYCYIMTVSA